MPLIEFYKTVPEKIFGIHDSKLNWLVNILSYEIFSQILPKTQLSYSKFICKWL